MKKCKVCGAEVAQSAKMCPHCGAKLKGNHPILIAVLFIVVIAAIVGSSSEDQPKKVDNASSVSNIETDNTQTEKSKNEFYVGETAELNDVCVTFVEVKQSNGSKYNKPTSGNVYVLCEFEIANNSDEEIAVSSMLSFEAYCDDYTCTYSLSALLEKGNKNQLDGSVAPGKKFRGVVGYEVPTDWKEMEIAFTPEFWTGKDILFVATNN